MTKGFCYLVAAFVMLFFMSPPVLAMEKVSSCAPVCIDTSSLSLNIKKAIDESVADYQSVLVGKTPVYAKVDVDAPVSADGGTSFWKGNGYSLVISKSLTTIGGVNGYIYGPSITFDKAIAQGNASNISQLSFYSTQKLNEMQQVK